MNFIKFIFVDKPQFLLLFDVMVLVCQRNGPEIQAVNVSKTVEIKGFQETAVSHNIQEIQTITKYLIAARNICQILSVLGFQGGKPLYGVFFMVLWTKQFQYHLCDFVRVLAYYVFSLGTDQISVYGECDTGVHLERSERVTNC